MTYVVCIFLGLTLCLGGASYYMYRQNSALHDKTGKLEIANVELGATVAHLTNSITEMADKLTITINKQVKIDEDVKKSKEVLEKHGPENLNMLMQKKATLIEKRVNIGTQKALLKIENLTDPAYAP